MEGDFEPPGRRAADPVRPARPGRRHACDYAVEIPQARLADPEARPRTRRCAGLDRPSRATDWPPVPIVFWSFRIMVGLGLLMLRPRALEPARALRAARLYDWRWLHRARGGHGAGGLRRGDRRLDHHRGRPPALHGLRPAAHRAVASRRSRRRRSPPRCSPSWSSTSSSSAPASSTSCADGQAAARAASPSRQRGRRSAPPASRPRPRSIPTAIAGRSEAAMAYASTSRSIWAGVIAFAVFAYVVHGRLRPRHRHPVPVLRGRAGARHR